MEIRIMNKMNKYFLIIFYFRIIKNKVMSIVLFIIILLIVIAAGYFLFRKKDDNNKQTIDQSKLSFGNYSNFKRDLYIKSLFDNPENINKQITIFYADNNKQIPIGIDIDKSIVWCNNFKLESLSDFSYETRQNNDNVIVLTNGVDSLNIYNYYDDSILFNYTCKKNNITNDKMNIIVSNDKDIELSRLVTNNNILIGKKSNVKRTAIINEFVKNENKIKPITIYYQDNTKTIPVGIEFSLSIVWDNFNDITKLNEIYYYTGAGEKYLKLCNNCNSLDKENSITIGDYKDQNNIFTVSYKTNGIESPNRNTLIIQNNPYVPPSTNKKIMAIKSLHPSSSLPSNNDINKNKFITVYLDSNNNPVNMELSAPLTLDNLIINKIHNIEIKNENIISYKIPGSVIFDLYYNNDKLIFDVSINSATKNYVLEVYEDTYIPIDDKYVRIVYKNEIKILDNTLIKEIDFCENHSEFTPSQNLVAQEICNAHQHNTIIELKTSDITKDNCINNYCDVTIPYIAFSYFDKTDTNIINMLKILFAKYTRNLYQNISDLRINNNTIIAKTFYKLQDVSSVRKIFIKSFGFSGNKYKYIDIENISVNNILTPYNVIVDRNINMPSFVTDSNNNNISASDLTVTSVIQNEDETFDIKVTSIYNYGFIIKNYSPSRYNFIVIKCSNGNEDENNGFTDMEIFKSINENGYNLIYKDEYKLIDNKIILELDKCAGICPPSINNILTLIEFISAVRNGNMITIQCSFNNKLKILLDIDKIYNVYGLIKSYLSSMFNELTLGDVSINYTTSSISVIVI